MNQPLLGLNLVAIKPPKLEGIMCSTKTYEFDPMAWRKGFCAHLDQAAEATNPYPTKDAWNRERATILVAN